MIISLLAFAACNNTNNNENPEDTSVSADSSVTEPVTGNPPVNPTDTMVNIDTASASVTDTAVH